MTRTLFQIYGYRALLYHRHRPCRQSAYGGWYGPDYCNQPDPCPYDIEEVRQNIPFVCHASLDIVESGEDADPRTMSRHTAIEEAIQDMYEATEALLTAPSEDKIPVIKTIKARIYKGTVNWTP